MSNGNGATTKQANGWHTPAVSFRVSMAVVLAAIGQAIFFTQWLVSMHADVEQLKLAAREINKKVENVDAEGARALARLNEITLNMTRDVMSAAGRLQSQIDVDSQQIKALRDQQERLYNLLVGENGKKRKP